MDNALNIQAYRKLDESQFFLDLMKETSDNDEVIYYYSAFLSAWKSVLDVLLFDYAIIFNFGIERGDRFDPKFFRWVAKYLKNDVAVEFISWWEKQVRSLSKNPLWEARNIYIHRGYPDNEFIAIYVPSSISSSYYPIVRGHVAESFENGFTPGHLKIPYVLEQFDPELIEDCEVSLNDMKTIVDEAKRYANVE